MLGGLFVDGWAHRNNKPETFFSPWHGILYSGFLASAVLLLRVIRKHQAPGQHWRSSIPAGYGIRMIGLGIFGVGGLSDFVWHSVFGIEVDIEALLSPAHLVLLTGGLLMGSGPLISTMHRARVANQNAPDWAHGGLASITIMFGLSLIQFFLMYLSPYDRGIYTEGEFAVARDRGGEWLSNQLLVAGIGSIVIFSITTTIALLFVVRQFKVPIGALSIVLIGPAFLQTVLVSFDTAARLVGPILAAIVAEATWRQINARSQTSTGTRAVILTGWIATVIAVQWFGFFAAVSQEDGGIAWSTPVWAGVPLFAAMLCAILTISTSLNVTSATLPSDQALSR
jgi:hypothetical protein